MHPELTNHVIPPQRLAFLNEPAQLRKEESAANNQDEHNNPRQKLLHLIKALIGGLATFLTIVSGWPIIERILSFFASFLD